MPLTDFQNCSILYQTTLLLRQGRREELKRCSFDIMAEILQESLIPRRKTQIMFRSNLSFSQFKTYLRLLQTSGLIQREIGKFKITNKGLEFLQVYDELIGLLRESPSKTEGKSFVTDTLVYVKPLVNKATSLSDDKPR